MSDDMYHQAKTSLSTVSGDLQKILRQDLQAFRAAIDERIETLDTSLSQTDALFEGVAQQLASLAADGAAQAAAQVRLQCEQAAQRDVDAARAEAREELARLRGEADATRAALEAQLADAHQSRDQAAAATANAQHEIAAARRAWEEQSRRLDEAAERIRTLEADHTQWALARQVAEAHLEEERQRRKTITIQMEMVREELHLAMAEAKTFRLQSQQLADRLARFEEAPAAPRTVSPTEQADDRRRHAALGQLQRDLQALNTCQSADEILTILIDSLIQQFTTVALFAVTSQGFKFWRGRSQDRSIDVAVPIVPLGSESPLARAYEQRRAVVTDPMHADATLPLGVRSIGLIAAFPLVSNDRVRIVAYVEIHRDYSEEAGIALTKIAEILIDRVNLRLQRAQPLTATALPDPPRPATIQPAGPPVPESPHYVLARQVRRVPIHDGVTVLIDGMSSSLVDLSTLGAQIVSTSTVRPNRPVRVVLQGEEGPLSCRGRVVWARVERTQETEPVRYRAGLEFTEANASALQAFAAQHGVAYVAPATVMEH